VIVAVALAGALFVTRPGTGGGGSDALAPISVLSPTEAGFDASTAAAVWSSGIDDPVVAATTYLDTIGVATATAAAASDAATPVLREVDGATAIVDWTTTGASAQAGTVYLRAATTEPAVGDWVVVGALSDAAAVGDISYDGEELSFTVSRTSALADAMTVSVWADGQLVSLGGQAVARTGAPGMSLGELLDIGAGAGASQVVALALDAASTITIRVEHVADGLVRSVTEVVLALPGADPALVAGVAGAAADAGAGAGATASSSGAAVSSGTDATAGDSSATATGEAGVTLPTLPPLPLPTLPVPPLPELPAPSVPGLPAPEEPPSTIGLP
jgi:hypothetical protein